MVLDLKLPKRGGFELLEQIKQDERHAATPVIVYTGKELTQGETTKLRKLADTIIVKDASSPERLLDETALFLHRVEKKLPQQKRRLLEQLHSSGGGLQGQEDPHRRRRRAQHLRPDERARGTRHGGRSTPRTARMASSAPEHAGRRPRPDGHHDAGARRLRDDARDPRRGRVQAAADHLAHGEGDEGRPGEGIAAGASDYITKPVDTDQLLSLMRVWLYK